MIKYFWPIKSVLFYIALLGCLTGCYILAHYSYHEPCSCQVQFDIQTSEPVDFSIYYDIGAGWIQEDFQTKRIDTINQKTTIDFCIPMYSQLHGIRFDPDTKPVKMNIYSITLTYADGSVYQVPWDSLIPGKQIHSHSWDNTSFTFESLPNANDANFILSKLGKQDVQKEINKKILYYGIWLLGGLSLTFLIRFIILFFFIGI